MLQFIKTLITGRISHEAFMRGASESFRLQLMQEYDDDNLYAFAVKSHPDKWHNLLMDKLDAEYKSISERGSLREQKLGLRAAALDNLETTELFTRILKEDKNDLLYLGKHFSEEVELEGVMQECIHMGAVSYFSTLSFAAQSKLLGDDGDGDWLSGYAPFIKLATRELINVMRLKQTEDTVDGRTYKMFKDAADMIKMKIISGEFVSPNT
jgi:hypothetical protein